LIEKNRFPVKVNISYKDWAQKIKAHFEERFYIEVDQENDN